MSSRADLDMDASRITRGALIEKHAGAGTIVMPQHFSSPSCCTIERAGDAFRCDFIADS